MRASACLNHAGRRSASCANSSRRPKTQGAAAAAFRNVLRSILNRRSREAPGSRIRKCPNGLLQISNPKSQMACLAPKPILPAPSPKLLGFLAREPRARRHERVVRLERGCERLRIAIEPGLHGRIPARDELESELLDDEPRELDAVRIRALQGLALQHGVQDPALDLPQHGNSSFA